MRMLLIIFLTFILSGCAAWDRKTLATNGVKRDLDLETVNAFKQNQDAILEALREMAGISTSLNSLSSAEWHQLTRAGFIAVDQECHQYMSALYRIDQKKKENLKQIGLFATTTAVVQEILGETAKTIALTTAGFGLLEGAYSIHRTSILFQLKPSVVNEIVRKIQSKSSESLAGASGAPFDRTLALNAIYQYAEQCTPLRIETEVDKALKAATASNVDPSPSSSGLIGATLD